MENKYNVNEFTLEKFKEIMNHYFNEKKEDPYEKWKNNFFNGWSLKSQELFHEAVKKEFERTYGK